MYIKKFSHQYNNDVKKSFLELDSKSAYTRAKNGIKEKKVRNRFKVQNKSLKEVKSSGGIKK